MFPQLAFDLGRVADEIKLVDLMIVVQRHHGASYEIRRAEIAAHRIQGDLHWWETLRTKASDCKAKNGGTCAKRLLFHVGSWHSRRLKPTFLRASALVAHGNNHTTDKRYAIRLRCHIAGICLATGRASGSPLCANAIASSKFCVLGLPYLTRRERSRKPKKDNSETYFRFNFSLSSSLQFDLPFVSCSAISMCFALQMRPPSRSQCGCAGRFSKRSSRMNGVRSTASGPRSSVCTAKAGTSISWTNFSRQDTQRSSTGCESDPFTQSAPDETPMSML